MNKFALIILLLGAQTGYAGDYETAVSRQKVCENMGKVGAMYYKLKEQGTPYDISTVDRKTPSGAITAKITDYAYYKAADLEDAYMRGWAICMDSLAALE